MSTAKDYVGTSGFGFAHTLTFTRQRRKTVVDPYDPDNTTLGDWSDPDELSVTGGLASLSSVEQNDAVRVEAVSTARYVSADPDVDVRRGDRLLAPDGRKWAVVGYPAIDRNVFTGWQPTLVAALEEVVG